VASYALPRFFTTGCFLPLPFSVLSAVSQWMVACPIPPCSQSQGMGFSCRARPPVVRHWDLLQQMPAMLLSCYVSAQLSRFCEILAIEGSSNCNKRSLLDWSSTHCTQTKLITLLLRNVANSIISCDSSCLGGMQLARRMRAVGGGGGWGVNLDCEYDSISTIIGPKTSSSHMMRGTCEFEMEMKMSRKA
jgi:hypothetical protein